MYVDLASMKNKKKYDLIQMWGLKVEGLLMIRLIEEMVFYSNGTKQCEFKRALVNKWTRSKCEFQEAT